MKNVIEITVCDICKRDTSEVNTEALSGDGWFSFDWSLGGFSGGTSDTHEYDLCCECTVELRKLLTEFKNQRRKECKD